MKRMRERSVLESLLPKGEIGRFVLMLAVVVVAIAVAVLVLA